ncbi:MAG: hypothetical protein ACREXX_12580, partial [Gammaproteobacteria bacterium]
MEAYVRKYVPDVNFNGYTWCEQNLNAGSPGKNDLSGVFTSKNDQPMLKPGEAVYFYGGRAAIYNALAGYDWAILKSPSGVKTYMYRTVIKMKTFGRKKQVFMFTPYDEAFHKLLTNFWDIDNRGIIGDYGAKMGEF